MQKSHIDSRRKIMLVVVALTLSWFVASSLLLSGEKSDRNFYSMIAATIVCSIIARFVWRCPFCNAWLGKGWVKDSCACCGRSFTFPEMKE